MLTEIEQQCLDIDWFFIADDKIGFVASGGGKLPNFVAQSSESMNEISSFMKTLPQITEVEINNNLKEIKGTTIENSYLEDFIFMAKRGLYSFDKTYLNNFSDTHYHLVAKPISPLTIDRIPINILSLVKNTWHDSDLSKAMSIKSCSVI